MDSNVNFYYESKPTADQIALSDKLKLIDPDGFGGKGWDLRWKQWLFSCFPS